MRELERPTHSPDPADVAVESLGTLSSPGEAAAALQASARLLSPEPSAQRADRADWLEATRERPPSERKAGTNAAAEQVKALLARCELTALSEEEQAELLRLFSQLCAKPDREAADALLEAIDAGPLALYHHDGLMLRTLAVEALIDLGHPWALEVPPKALEEALADREKRDRWRHAPWLGWSLFAAGTVVSGALMFDRSWEGAEQGAMVLSVVELLVYGLPVIFASSRQGTVNRWLGMFLLTAISAFEIFAGTRIGALRMSLTGWPLILGGGLKLLSVPFFRLKKRQPRK